jgi:TetR/AcrR family transcriptional repressor of nem operon
VKNSNTVRKGKSMARAQFDRDDVIDKSIALFWNNGFSASSMKQVVQVTGLKPGSLYLAFGNKEALFHEALQRYAEKGIAQIRNTLDSAPCAGEGICTILETIVQESTRENYCSCFLVKTQLELAVEENELYDFASTKLGEIEKLYQSYLKKEFSATVSRNRATSLMLHIFGVRVYGYQRGSADRMRQGLREGLPWLPWAENILASNQQLAQLTQEAKKLGATSSTIISSNEIQVEDHLAALCNGDYTCPNYGIAASCPPNVEGPVEFRKWRAQSKYSITVKIELPTKIMFSGERKGVMQLLHQIVATVEQKAIEIGYKNSKGFAGGSCKDLFCEDQEKCCVLAESKPCRHKELARPSMSGFGIDVIRLMASSGWSAAKAEKSDVSDNNATTWVAGLIMLA